MCFDGVVRALPFNLFFSLAAQVEEALTEALLDIVDKHRGGILGEAHSWIG